MGAVGFSLIERSEGLRTSAYIDPVGIPTICYGHTGPEVRLGLKYTVAQCKALLMYDIEQHRLGLSRCITAPVTQNQADAMVSLTFNLGVGKTCASTLVRKFNAGDTQGAAQEFTRWKYANVNGRNVVLPGLVTRRAAERALFLSTKPAVAVEVQFGHLAI